MSEFISRFHFLRPEWLLLLIPCALLLVLVWRDQKGSGSWQKVIAPELLSHLLQGQSAPQNAGH